jgi:hypothetical protein
MGVDALGRKIVSLSAAIALTAACTRSVPVRDASVVRVSEGAAEPQPADSAAPATQPAPATAPPPTAQGDSADGSNRQRDPHFMRRVLGWVALSIGAEAAVIAVVTSGMIEHQKSIRDDNCNAQKVCNTDGFNAAGTISTIVPWNTATWFVAAAGISVGTVLVLISPPGSEKRTALTLSPESSGLQLGVRSTF